MNKDSKITLRSGNKMPIIGLGTWELTEDTAETVMDALEMGYRMIDTSSDYNTQPEVGAAIRASGLEREQIFLVAKVEEDDEAYQATKDYLQEMQQEYADLMLIHRPPSSGAGEQLWQGLIKAKREGLAKDIGVSNYSIQQIQALIEATGEIPAVNQIEWSPFGYSVEMLDFCRLHGIVVQAYSPLTRGERLDDDTVVAIADKYETSPAAVLIRWAIELNTVPIIKASKLEHMQENLEALDIELDSEDMDKLSELNEQFSALSDKPIYMKSES